MNANQKRLLAKVGNGICLAALVGILGFSLLLVYFCFMGAEADPTSDRVNPAETAWQLLLASHLLSVSFFGLMFGKKINSIIRLTAASLFPSFLVLLYAIGYSGQRDLSWGALLLPVLWYLPLGVTWARGFFLDQVDHLDFQEIL